MTKFAFMYIYYIKFTSVKWAEVKACMSVCQACLSGHMPNMLPLHSIPPVKWLHCSHIVNAELENVVNLANQVLEKIKTFC